jgi:Tfp pilus assembly protein PilX
MIRSFRDRRRQLSSESGFTMIVTLGVLLVSSLLMAAAFVAAQGDIRQTQSDTAAKKAYYAAQAGVQDYEYHLTQDGNYLTYCTSPTPANSALNQYYKEGTKEPLKASELKTAEVPAGPKGESSGEKYAIQLLPAESNTETNPKCNTSNVVESMIEQKLGSAAGTFRLKATGFAEGKERTIVATFKNANFVSYVWYNEFETGDPSLYGSPEPDCGKFYGERPSACNAFNNYFISGESINGPIHTSDHVGICGNPTFGRNENDRIEFGNGNNKTEAIGYSTEGGCGGEKAEPNFKGKLIPPSEVLSITPPPGDEELEHVVEAGYKFNGKTEIILGGSTLTIKEHVGSTVVGEEEKIKTNVAYPANGVIYVSGGCETLYSPFGPVPGYGEDSECGNVYVNGSYTRSLTIAAQNDVVINGSITTTTSEEKPSTSAMLGLIANNFVRVYHPLSGTREQKFRKCGTSSNAPEDLNEPTIYAAILALKHSFIVDNFDCGKPELGSLKVYGAIAGLYTNGMTGVFSGKTVLSGYGYNLKYDSRLQVAEPPHFLNPIEAAWYVLRETLAPNP